MKKMIQKSYYNSPILYNARQRALKELESKGLREIAKEIGISVNTLQKIKNEEIITFESAGKLIDWSDKKQNRTPLSILLQRQRLQEMI